MPAPISNSTCNKGQFSQECSLAGKIVGGCNLQKVRIPPEEGLEKFLKSYEMLLGTLQFEF